jgi:hypothetical protein
LGVLLYFAAGLLPDPDGPFQPETQNWYTWILAIVFEILIIILAQLISYGVKDSRQIGSAGIALGAFRVATLLVMSMVFILIGNRQQIALPSAADETESLLINGATSSGYGSASAPKPKTLDAQSTGWLDYFVGFRKLFPYIW